jgi:hypothetical protein
MRKLPVVEDARAIMKEGTEWGVWKWLVEKKRVREKEADDDAYNAHEDAEDIFAEAEKRMSTSGAREGARKALEAYDLHEAAIRKAEALAHTR